MPSARLAATFSAPSPSSSDSVAMWRPATLEGASATVAISRSAGSAAAAVRDAP